MEQHSCLATYAAQKAAHDVVYYLQQRIYSPSSASQHWPAALCALTSWKLLGWMAESSLPSLALQ